MCKMCPACGGNRHGKLDDDGIIVEVPQMLTVRNALYVSCLPAQ